MLKTATFLLLFGTAVFFLGSTNASSLNIQKDNLITQKIDCDHYFEKVIIWDKTYIIEYDCDGAIVNVTEVY
jgi:hypothetical protein